MNKILSRTAYCLAALVLLITLSACGNEESGGEGIRLAVGGKVVSLDPAFAADTASQRMCAALFDTLLEYEYPALPYRLRPGMLAAMPEISADGFELHCTLRDDLFFVPDECFDDSVPEERRVTSADVVFSFLRIADGRNHTANYSLIRGKIAGIDDFYRKTSNLPKGDDSCYNDAVEGFRIINDREFVIRLTRPDQRFLYVLAIPAMGIVSRKACLYYGDISEHPVGSGPFRLEEWIREYKISLLRNPDYRLQYFPEAENLNDRSRPLPLAERIECFCIRQNQSAWLLFLQGGLDVFPLARENADVVVNLEDGSVACIPELAAKGIEPLRSPALEIQYIGFNMSDPVLGSNVLLRRALSMALNRGRLAEFYENLVQPAGSPLPPGVPEMPEGFFSPWCVYDPAAAAELLVAAGYPGGKDPATGRSLHLTLDLNGNSAQHRQTGEIFASDMAKIGVTVEPVLNNSPRFFQKLASGEVELFRLSWQGDYPDCENFLQLFTSDLVGGANRSGYSNTAYDMLYREYLLLEPGAEREEKIKDLLQQVTDDCPWICESVPVAYILKHSRLVNLFPHEFSFGAWKYLAVR